MADDQSELSPFRSNEGVANFVAGIKGFLVWLGGSLASIIAIFHATGYLVTRAHLSMLGLHGVIDFDNEDIVREGGKFFFVLGYAVVRGTAVPLLIDIVQLTPEQALASVAWTRNYFRQASAQQSDGLSIGEAVVIGGVIAAIVRAISSRNNDAPVEREPLRTRPTPAQPQPPPQAPPPPPTPPSVR